MSETILKAFEQPDEVREFPLGRFEIVHVASVTFGRATYQPGGRWSKHNAPKARTLFCPAPHTGVVLSGHGMVAYEDGKQVDLLPAKPVTSRLIHTTAGWLGISLTFRCTF
jgi:quercetin dioxygenase-like cupin family protein